MVNNNQLKEDEYQAKESLGLNVLMLRVLSYWPLLILALLLTFITAKIYLRYTPKIYRVHARVIVNDDDQQKSSSNLLNIQLNGPGYNNPTEKEVEILQSRSLLSMVVKKLSLQTNFSKAGSVKETELFGKSSPVNLALLDAGSITQPLSGKVILNGNQITYLGKNFPIDSIVESDFGRVIWTKNAGVPFDYELTLDVLPIQTATLLLKRQLKVIPITNQSSLVDLFYLDQDPERGKVILNKILETYSSNYLEFERRIAQNTLRFVDDRLSLVANELNDVEKELERFKSKEGIVNLTSEGELFLNEVNQYDQKLSEINVQLKVLDDLNNYVNKRNDEVVSIPATLGLNDPLLQALMQQLFQAEFELERLTALSGPKNPQIGVIKEQINKLKPSLNQSITNLKNTLLQSKNSISAITNSRESALRKIPQKERLLLDISRQQGIKNSIYTFLLQKREEAAISSASIVPNNRVIDTPESMGVESPKVKIIYLYCWSIYFLLLGLYIYFKEFANRNFLYRQELEESVRLPIVAELIYTAKSDKGIVVNHGLRNVINEQFKELRTNISFLNKSKSNQAILVTSSTSGEGKSFVSINLAISLANAGRKVAVLEFDLRKPKIHNYLGIEKGNGLSNFLVGNADLNSIVKSVSGIDNLYILTSGHLPPNPAELLMNNRMAEIFNYLKLNFDYIIIDAPPVGLVTDAKLITPFADTCLYVVRYNYTNRNFADLIRNLKNSNSLPSMNIVFNAIAEKKMLGYGYGYGYNYNYGYGNGYVDDERSDNGPVTRFKKFFRIK